MNLCCSTIYVSQLHNITHHPATIMAQYVDNHCRNLIHNLCFNLSFVANLCVSLALAVKTG